MSATTPDKTSGREKARRHREKLRAQGLRPLQIWVPDTRAPGFAEELARQARAVAASREEAEVNAFIERVTDWGG